MTYFKKKMGIFKNKFPKCKDLIDIFTGQGIHLKPTNQEITQSLFQDQEFAKKSQITVKSQNRTFGDTLPVIVASATVKTFLNIHVCHVLMHTYILSAKAAKHTSITGTP